MVSSKKEMFRRWKNIKKWVRKVLTPTPRSHYSKLMDWDVIPENFVSRVHLYELHLCHQTCRECFFNLFLVGLLFQINSCYQAKYIVFSLQYFFPAYWYQHYKGEQEVGAHYTREVGKDSIQKKMQQKALLFNPCVEFWY